RFELQSGDALLVTGSVEALRRVGEEGWFAPTGSVVRAHGSESRRTRALTVTIAVLAAAIAGVVPTSVATVTGAVLIVLLGCLPLDEIYQAIEWRVVLIIAGLLPLGNALVDCGLGQMATTFLTHQAWGRLGLIAALSLLALILTQLVGGQVAALILAPMVVTLPGDLRACAVAVSIACSAAFLTPIAHPVNLLMMRPGGYSARDYLRVGAGLSIVAFITLLLGMHFLFQV
ncbi:MAG: SLC13 family permease, partial [Candidatus Xenobia bacterium]